MAYAVQDCVPPVGSYCKLTALNITHNFYKSVLQNCTEQQSCQISSIELRNSANDFHTCSSGGNIISGSNHRNVVDIEYECTLRVTTTTTTPSSADPFNISADVSNILSSSGVTAPTFKSISSTTTQRRQSTGSNMAAIVTTPIITSTTTTPVSAASVATTTKEDNQSTKANTPVTAGSTRTTSPLTGAPKSGNTKKQPDNNGRTTTRGRLSVTSTTVTEATTMEEIIVGK